MCLLVLYKKNLLNVGHTMFDRWSGPCFVNPSFFYSQGKSMTDATSQYYQQYQQYQQYLQSYYQQTSAYQQQPMSADQYYQHQYGQSYQVRCLPIALLYFTLYCYRSVALTVQLRELLAKILRFF